MCIPKTAASIAPLLALALAAACTAVRPPSGGAYGVDYVIAETAASGKVDGRPTWMDPLPIPGRSELIFPFAVQSRLGLFSDYDPFKEGGLPTASYSGGGNNADGPTTIGPIRVRWHNATVLDVANGREFPVLERRGVISQLWIHGPNLGSNTSRAKATESDSTTVLMLATVADSNGDGSLDDRDASRALLVDFESGAARLVSPPGMRVQSATFDLVPGAVVLMIAQDRNGDSKFDRSEAPLPYVVDLRTGGAARPLLNDSVVQRVEGFLAN